MAYNNSPEGPQAAAAGGGASSPMSSMPSPMGGICKNNKSLPTIYDEDRKGYPNAYGSPSNMPGAAGPSATTTSVPAVNANYTDEGMSYYFASQPKQFGYNMPPLKHWPSNDPASNCLKGGGSSTSLPGMGGGMPGGMPGMPGGGGSGGKCGFGKEQWQPWREALVGVNKYYLPDEGNEISAEAHNMSAQYGGWNELKLYQARCNNWFGLNCICDFEKNFFPGTSLGYALYRAGKVYTASNEIKMREESVPVATPSGYKDTLRTPIDKIAVDKTVRELVAQHVPVSKGQYSFEAILGQPVGGVTWPGSLGAAMAGMSSSDLKGLSNAKKGDIIYFDGETTKAKSAKRPWTAAFVEEVRQDGCLRVTMANNGTMRDAYEVTENWGVVTERIMCPSVSTQNMSFKIASLSSNSCIYPNLVQCVEDDWDNWKIYRWKGNPGADGSYDNWDSRKFDPVTGQLQGQ